MARPDLSALSLEDLSKEYQRKSRELERQAVELAFRDWEEHVDVVVETVREQIKSGTIADCTTPQIPSLAHIALGKLDKLLKQSRGNNGTMA